MSNRARKGTRVKLTRERDAVLNKDDDQARDYLNKYHIKYPTWDPAFQRMKHTARIHAFGVYPKLKKASREWLKEHCHGGQNVDV